MDTASPPPRSEPKSLQLRHLPRWVPYLLIALAGIAAYGLSLNSDFYMDDYPFVLGKGMVTGESWEVHDSRGLRAVPFLLWRGAYSIAGASAPLFHALNLATHLAVASALFLFGVVALRKFGKTSIEARRAALIGSLIFIVHPFASEGVNYVRNLELQLVTLFMLLAATASLRALKAARPITLLSIAVFSALAIWSKEPGFFHLATTLGLLAFAIFERERFLTITRACLAKSKLASLAVIGLALALLLPLCAKFTGIAFAKLSYHGAEHYWHHALTQGRVFWEYLAKMFAPFGLSSDHLVAWSTSSSDLPGLLGLLGVVGLVAFVIIGARTKRFRLAAMLAGMAIAPLVLRFLYPNGELFVEYRAYPGLPFFGLLAGLALSALYGRAPSLGKWGGLALITTLAVMSAMRTSTWGNAEWLAEDVLERYPLNNRARTQLQSFALQSGEFDRVFEIQNGVKDAFLTINKKNKELPYGRQFDDGRAITNLANGQQLTALAIERTAGVSEALAFSQKSVEIIYRLTGGDQNQEVFLRRARKMLNVRNHLLQKQAAEQKAMADTSIGEPG